MYMFFNHHTAKISGYRVIRGRSSSEEPFDKRGGPPRGGNIPPLVGFGWEMDSLLYLCERSSPSSFALLGGKQIENPKSQYKQSLDACFGGCCSICSHRTAPPFHFAGDAQNIIAQPPTDASAERVKMPIQPDRSIQIIKPPLPADDATFPPSNFYQLPWPVRPGLVVICSTRNTKQKKHPEANPLTSSPAPPRSSPASSPS